MIWKHPTHRRKEKKILGKSTSVVIPHTDIYIHRYICSQEGKVKRKTISQTKKKKTRRIQEEKELFSHIHTKATNQHIHTHTIIILIMSTEKRDSSNPPKHYFKLNPRQQANWRRTTR